MAYTESVTGRSFNSLQFFYSDGQALSGSDYEEKSNGNERTLFVKNCTEDGEYTVQCENDKMSAKLKVNGTAETAAAEPPAPEPATVPESKPVASATPPAKTEEPKPKPR